MQTNAAPAVLLVGAGPVGLTLGCVLLRHGVSCRIVDMGSGPSTWSKASLIHARTLELLDDLGLADGAVRLGRRLFGLSLHAEGRRVAHLTTEGMDTPFPFILSLSQRETELLLLSRLRELGGRVEHQVTVEHFSSDDEGVTVELRHQLGPKETIRVPYLVGCDGVHSQVRKGLHLPFVGSDYEQVVLQGDVRLRWPEGTRPEPDEIKAYFSPAGPLVLTPLAIPDRYRLQAFVSNESDIEPSLQNLQDLLQARGPGGAAILDPEWMAVFRFSLRIAPRYQVGRVLLCGDAAHTHSPITGQGMNLGMQDAYNLGWKLALSALGVARPLLLDSYQDERRPQAEATLAKTDAMTQTFGHLMALRNPLAKELRDQVLQFVSGLQGFRERLVRGVGMLDGSYRDSPIVDGHKEGLLMSHLSAEIETGRSGVREWLEFRHGPSPGDPAADVELPAPAPKRERLFQLLHGTRHTLLLFLGEDPSPGDREAGLELADEILATRGDLITVYLVLRTDQPDALAPVILDLEGAVSDRYGARGGALYLIRPDGVVGFRSQPIHRGALFQHLSRIFA